MSDPIVIVAARRTPIASFQGSLSSLAAHELGAAAIRAAVADSHLDGEDISELIMGCVLPAGLGQAPARQAALGAGLPVSVGCLTINKVCGSGMKSAMLGHDLIAAGSANIVVAGGMESMSNAVYLLPKARGGLRMGHAEVIDHMLYDGLQNPYDGQMMGAFGERCAQHYGFSREAQDSFATESVRRAMRAMANGDFGDEIVPLPVTTRQGDTTVDSDEEPPRCDIDRIPHFKPAFQRDGGTVTAANASSISDGAAALVLMRDSEAQRRGLTVLARVSGHATHAQEPGWFTTAPVAAIRKLHERLGWSPDEVDLYEINEAFAVVAMAAIKDLGLDHAKVNVNGGACALGHPIGATGARIIVTLLHALRRRGLKRGVASLCLGGGEATAIGIERPSS